MSLVDLKSISGGVPRVSDLTLVEGAMPPDFITSMAVADLGSGKPPLWCSYFLFVEGDRVVGSGGFRGIPSDGRVEIGYVVAPSCQGQGLATDSARLLAKMALEQPEVTEVYAETAVANTPSRRVVEKAGFRHIGQRDTESDGLVDCWLYPKSPRPSVGEGAHNT